MLRYPALIEPDTTGFVVSFRDFPEALSAGATLKEARLMATDALLTAIDLYFEGKCLVPMPSSARNDEELVALPASVCAKILLVNVMLCQNVTRAELASRLDVRPKDVDRFISLDHATKIDSIARALAALGRRLEIGVS